MKTGKFSIGRGSAPLLALVASAALTAGAAPGAWAHGATGSTWAITFNAPANGGNVHFDFRCQKKNGGEATQPLPSVEVNATDTASMKRDHFMQHCNGGGGHGDNEHFVAHYGGDDSTATVNVSKDCAHYTDILDVTIDDDQTGEGIHAVKQTGSGKALKAAGSCLCYLDVRGSGSRSDGWIRVGCASLADGCLCGVSTYGKTADQIENDLLASLQNAPGVVCAYREGSRLAIVVPSVFTGVKFGTNDPGLGYRFTVVGPRAKLPPLPQLSSQPNPFNPRTTLSFALEREQAVALDVYDLAGRRVAALLNGTLPAGRHEAVWDGHDQSGRAVCSGTYVCRLRTGEEVTTTRITLLK